MTVKRLAILLLALFVTLACVVAAGQWVSDRLADAMDAVDLPL